MTRPESESWTPSPEWLAAYADGELDGQPHLEGLIVRIEDYLRSHPEALAEIEAHESLRRLMAASAPEEPSAQVWDAMLARIEQPRRPRSRWAAATLWFAGIAAASAAAVLLSVYLQRGQSPQPSNNAPFAQAAQIVAAAVNTGDAVNLPAQVEILQVASADEVEILHVAGADTGSLIIGRLPFSGQMLLVAPNEIEVGGSAGSELRIASGSSPIMWSPLPHSPDDVPEDNTP